MILVDPVLGFDALGVLIGLGLLWSAPRVIGTYRRVARALLGGGIALHRGYWGVWRWCGEYGEDLRWLYDALAQHQLVPWLATGAYIIGAGFALCAPWRDSGLLRGHVLLWLYAAAVLLWAAGSASPWVVRALLVG